MKVYLSGQQKQVYDYIKAHPRTTIREAHKGIFPGVDKVSARLSEIENKGIKVKRHGRNSHREMMYSIEENVMETKKVVEMYTDEDGNVRAREVLVAV